MMHVLCVLSALVILLLGINDWLEDGLIPSWASVALLSCASLFFTSLFRRRRKPVVPVMPQEAAFSETSAILPYRSSLPQLASELARARRYQYPLTMVILRLDQDQLVEKGRGIFSMRKTEEGFLNLLLSFIGSLLRSSLRDIDIVSFDVTNSQYVVLLPETTIAKAERPVARLNGMSQNQTGVSLMVGMAEFPTDGLIIEDLVSKAEALCRRLSVAENARGLTGKEKQRSHSPQGMMR